MRHVSKVRIQRDCLADHVKNFGLYSKSNGKPPNGLKNEVGGA